ncbi:uncharacterized protein K452DRAFT_315479 [Aplosporella prunicola CBS 121167]|uniref:Uncharacterized protein n=1 Tax=Aplosporella prunicola CBS 121167 TaxID=1176127 RepID=A0A6A6BQ61_9PEZI|nr:uncharacterized protein K452DRAFT_315479 [Aplosporella prunicola CBS 121167]KAF2146269.1 hypothetical protein K452DRAFT_315479 [Aplosporella prunicola CBS 121167]
MAASETVDPSLAQGAQVPLQTFTIPQFPPEAQELKALTLTSDIKLDEYTSQLETFTPIPPLPKGIQSLSLELFSLGYPPGFLSALSDALPNIKSFDAYSQLLCGISPESQADALSFFEKSRNLRAIQLLDVFARPGFFAAVGEKLSESGREKSLMFLQLNYTYRHEDPEFLSRIACTELPMFILPSLVMCSFNIAAPDTTNDPEDPSNLTADGEETKRKAEGVMMFDASSSNVLVRALLNDETAPVGLKVLNTTLYTLSLGDLKEVLGKHRGLLVINVTVEIEPDERCKEEMMEALAQCPEVEHVELVGSPTLDFSKATKEARRTAFPSADDMQQFSQSCPSLQSFTASVLRTTAMGQVKWLKESDVWHGDLTIC